MKNLCLKDNEEKWRTFSILSYIVVLIGFGIPIWWHTTRVYRASLPLSQMLELKDFVPVPLNVKVQGFTPAKTDIMMRDIQFTLGSSANVSVFSSSLHLPMNVDEIPLISKGVVLPGSILLVEWPNAPKDIIFSPNRIIYYRSNVNAMRLSTLLSHWFGVSSYTAVATNPTNKENRNRLKNDAFSAASKYDVLVTIVDPDGRKFDWDLIAALNDYLKPYLDNLSTVANFTVKSQWLYFVDLGVNMRQVDNHFALAEQLMPHIITPLEKKLASHVSQHTCINLIVYVASCSMSPIYIYTKEGVQSKIQAFVSPRWGGLQIINPDCSAPLVTLNTPVVMSTIVTQFNRLFGIPNSFSEDELFIGEIPTEWQLDYLIRFRTSEYLNSARLTLRSLAKLLSEINNIVINDDVATDVEIAIKNIRLAEKYLNEKDILNGFKCAQIAATAAESAFTDPSLLALLYFPEDQKYAVYIPLFLPIMIPVIISMKHFFKYGKKKNTE